MEHQQNDQDVQPAVNSQENRTQNTQNNNRRQRMKWTKVSNIDIMRCYFQTVLRIPDQPYRKQFHQRWCLLHPELPLTEQRICDQQRTMATKVNTQENTRGSWLTEMEIQNIRNTIQLEIDNEQNQQVDQPNLVENPIDTQNEPAENDRVIQVEPLQAVREPSVEPPVQPVEEQDRDENDHIRTVLLDLYATASITAFEDRYSFRKPGKSYEFELKRALQKINKAIEDMPLLTEISDVSQLNDVTYACALLAIKNANLEKQCIVKKQNKRQTKKKDWQHDMNHRINEIRTDISKIEQMSIVNPSSKIKRNNNIMKNKYTIQDEQSRIRNLEILKQRLMALNNRLKRFTRREKQYHHNNTFQNDPGKFYDEVRDNKIAINEPPTEDDINSFWKPIFSNEQHFNKDAQWLHEYKDTVNERINEAEYQPIIKEEIKSATSKFQNWKSPGIDKIHNFWWCNLTNLHQKIADILHVTINHPGQSPPWLTTGRTTLVPKKPETRNPANYRPITCLPIIYKILTNIITNRMKHHIETNQIIPDEQKGCSNATYGTIDQLAINAMVMTDAVKKNRNISTAWIDYKKAFDSIPHDWLIESLKIHKFDRVTIEFFANTIKNWRTSLHLHTEKSEIKSQMFPIKNGIFQGDSPSGLHFIICLLPLTWLINKTNIGYKLSSSNQKVSHLMFMDDLKLYAPNDKLLKNLIDIVKLFSDDIRMNFGIDKCNKLTIIRGKVKQSDSTQLNNGDEIKSLNNQQYYKYLGFKEQDKMSPNTKAALKAEYFTRIKKVLKTELNSKNTISAINAYAVPALSYGFQIVDWSVTDLEAIDRSTRTLLQLHHIMHHQSDIIRIYMPRKSGGRGLINITNQYKKTIINFSQYLLNTDEPLLQTVSNWQLTRGERSIHTKARKYLNELNLDQDQMQILSKQQLKNNVKKRFAEHMMNTLQQKPLHGQHFRQLQQDHIDIERSNSWLKSSSLKRATESAICAIQEQAITTNYIKKHIHHTTNDDLCRVCRTAKETIHHIISGCTALAPTKYLKRHNDLAKYIYILLLQKYELDTTNHLWYDYTPQPVIENDRTKILWDFSIQTDHQIQHNKPDILILHKTERRATIIDIAVPNDSNIPMKRLEKLRNYTDLAVEIKTLWNLNKIEIVPFVIGATGVFYKGFDNDIEKLGLNGTMKYEICQKIILLGTAHIVRAFMQIA